jgi:hypothetical protein
VNRDDLMALGRKLGFDELEVPRVIKRVGLDAAEHELHQIAFSRRLAETERQAREEAARVARDKHFDLLDAEARARRQQRERMPLGQRVTAVLNEAVVLTEAPGTRWERDTARAKPQSAPPPKSGGALNAAGRSVVDVYTRQIERIVQMLEQEVDQARGLVTPPRGKSHAARERDLLARFRGWPAADVAVADPYWTPRRVRDARLRHGRDPETGNKEATG